MKKCSINKDLLPIKVHYFFFYGGISCTMPFIPILARSLGFNATAVGLIFTVLPFIVFFAKSFCGYLMDYFRNVKLILMILIVLTTASYLSMTFVPSILNSTKYGIQVETECSEDMILLAGKYDNPCMKDQLDQTEKCHMHFDPCDANNSVDLNGDLLRNNGSGGKFNLRFVPNPAFFCNCIAANTSFIQCDKQDIEICFSETNDPKFVYRTYEFWIFTILAVISGCGTASAFCLSDAASYEVLGDDSSMFGKQILWGTIGFGLATFLTGFLNDLATGDSLVQNYMPGFYLMIALIAIDVAVMSRVTLKKSNISVSICKDIGKIFSSFEIVTFSIFVYLSGALVSLAWNFEFWYLQDLGASQTLLGLAVATQCLAAELPFFYLSGNIIKKLGHFYCIALCFAAFSLRYGLYSLLQDPWWVLPIEVTHGLTFAVYYAAMTSFASSKAPPGTEATMMGILGGLYEGLGNATGTLLGGVGFDKLGGKQTFLVACCISLASLPLVVFSHYLNTKWNTRDCKRDSSSQHENRSERCNDLDKETI